MHWMLKIQILKEISQNFNKVKNSFGKNKKTSFLVQNNY